jgi:tight adherence protein C
MFLIFLIGVGLLGAAAVLALRAVAMPRLRAAELLGQIDAYGVGGAEEPEPKGPGLIARLDETAGVVGRFAASRLSSFDESVIRNELMSAGLYTTSPVRFLGYRLLCAAAVPAAFLWLATAGGGNPAFAIFGIGFGGLAGWIAPMRVLKVRAERRFMDIESDMPELIDLLVVTVEAGLGLNGSLQLASRRLKGPLGDEVRLALQEQRMGLSTNEALSNMLTRCPTPSVRSLVRSILQGENLGVSIGAIMRNLATEMRTRRRQNAEERAQKAPVKLLFPLVFLIFPPMFVVILFPAVYELMKTFNGG